MKYLFAALTMVLFVSACKKDSSYRYNPCRSIMLGNYHFVRIDYLYRDTARYDDSIFIPSSDNGNNIDVPIYGISAGKVFSTTDSSFTTLQDPHPMGEPHIDGYYSHQHIVVQGYDLNSPAGQTFLLQGVKY
jgi:hypothetical protein